MKSNDDKSCNAGRKKCNIPECKTVKRTNSFVQVSLNGNLLKMPR